MHVAIIYYYAENFSVSNELSGLENKAGDCSPHVVYPMQVVYQTEESDGSARVRGGEGAQSPHKYTFGMENLLPFTFVRKSY